MVVVMTNRLCYNCLRPGHFQPQRTSNHKCQKSHHTLLHQQFDHNVPATASTTANHGKEQALLAEVDDSSSCHSSHLSHPGPSGRRSMVLMMCQVVVMTSTGRMTKARALLDCAASTSFVMERLAQCLRLPHQRQNIQVTGIGGAKHGLLSHSVVSFNVVNQKPLCR